MVRARLANEVSETVVPTTFVDDAKLVWRLADKDMTQTDIGGVLGWGRPKVAQYAQLKKIDERAWKVVTENTEAVTIGKTNGVTEVVTPVTLFSEYLLRQILSLTSSQQLALVSDLATKKIDKKDGAANPVSPLKENKKHLRSW